MNVLREQRAGVASPDRGCAGRGNDDGEDEIGAEDLGAAEAGALEGGNRGHRHAVQVQGALRLLGFERGCSRARPPSAHPFRVQGSSRLEFRHLRFVPDSCSRDSHAGTSTIARDHLDSCRRSVGGRRMLRSNKTFLLCKETGQSIDCFVKHF